MQNNNILLSQVLLALKSGNQIHPLNFIDSIVDYCIENENGKVFGGWDKSIIRILVAYHIAKKTIITVFKDGKISGVFMWYYCNSSDEWDFIKEWEKDKPDGDSIFLAFIFASDTDSFKEICSDFMRLVPSYKDKKLISIRHRRGVSKKVKYNNNLFDKILSLKKVNNGQ